MHNEPRTFLRSAVLTVLAVLLCGGCTDSVQPGETTLERIAREGVVRVGFANEAPYAYLDVETGDLTGEAPEVLRAVMRTMGVERIESVLTEFGALIPGLRANRFDVIAAGMYITPERCEQIAFSNPSYSVGEGFIVLAGNPKDLHSYEDVRTSPDATLGVMAGAVERGYAREVGIPDQRVVVFPDGPSGVEALRIGRIDAFAGTSLTVRDLVSRLNDSRVELAMPFTDPVIDGKTTRGYGAFGFRKGDADLVEAFNVELAKFIGSEEHLALVQKFGFTEAELPGGVTASALCAAAQR